MSETIQHSDGRVELQPHALAEIEGSRLYNHDLAPVPIAKRIWTTYNYAALWISMAHCIPTYLLASGLIADGMNWWQALITILIANTIVLIPILLNSHPGTKYGIPFPVFARASYGTFGSNLPALMRAVVACGWFGINAWIGGLAVNMLLRTLFHSWEGALGGPIYDGFTATQWISFLLFWGLNIFIVYRGMNFLRHVENWAAPFVLIMTSVLLVWALWNANGIGPLLHRPGNFPTLRTFFPVFIPSLTAMIGFWATLSLNMPDFTRFGRSQREQALGQVVALPTTMTLFAAMSVVITSAALVIFPHLEAKQLWDPINLVGQFSNVWVVAISMFTIVVATLSVNIAANVVSPANDFANAFPRWVSFRTGGLITGILGIAMHPWRWLADPNGYIFTWLQGYSGGLASIAGVLIADYWLVRRKHLELGDLYRTEGVYAYQTPLIIRISLVILFALIGTIWAHAWRHWTLIPGVVMHVLLSIIMIALVGWIGWLLTRKGSNWRAILATFLGCFCAWIGAFIPGLKPLYDYAWFVGFGVSFLAHFILMTLFPPKIGERPGAETGT